MFKYAYLLCGLGCTNEQNPNRNSIKRLERKASIAIGKHIFLRQHELCLQLYETFFYPCTYDTMHSVYVSKYNDRTPCYETWAHTSAQRRTIDFSFQSFICIPMACIVKCSKGRVSGTTFIQEC